MTAGDLDEAERHLQNALELNRRMGAQAWMARTQCDLGSLHVARDRPGDRDEAIELLRVALDTANRLGMTALSIRITEDFAPARAERKVVHASPSASRSIFRCEGEYWAIAFEGDAFRLRDAKGLHYLTQLLQNPGREIHVLDLAASSAGAGANPRPLRARDDNLHDSGLSDTGPILDERAKASYRARFRELEEELNEATEWADSIRATKARQEMDFLADELSAAVGLGGRDRKAGSPAERARVNITRSIRAVLSRVREHSPTLAGHLDATIRTGTFCSYSPDPRAPIIWHVHPM
jgi:hypothetical protein